MSSLIRDIFGDPQEYLPFLLMFGGLVLFWVILCVCGFVSVRTSVRSRRFWFGLPAVLFGTVFMFAEIPVSIESEGLHLNFDFRWLFILPVLLGAAGFFLWWRGGRKALA